MTSWGKRKDGQAYPKGMPGGGKAVMNAEAIKGQTGAFEKAVIKKAEQLDSTDNKLAVTKGGEIRDGAEKSLKGADDQKLESKEIIKTEAGMVKEIKKVEHEKHPRPWEVKRAMADVQNLSVVHPELADKVVEK